MKASVLGMTDGAIIQTRLLPILSADRDNNIVLLRHIMVIEKRRMLHILMLTLAMVSTIELTIHSEVDPDQGQILLDSKVEWQKKRQAQTRMMAADRVAVVSINLALASVDPSC